LIENINAKIKVFKIFSQKYRNRRKRHQLRISLVCGIYNFALWCCRINYRRGLLSTL